MIEYACGTCGEALESPESAAGQQALCPKCGAVCVVPAEAVKTGAPTCRNHPTVAAADRCTACAETFCPSCLVEIQGRRYCGSCKMVAVQGMRLPEQITTPCTGAGWALLLAILGLVLGCFGVVLGPIAIWLAANVRKRTKADPLLTGSGKAITALVLGILALLFGLYALGNVSQGTSRYR